MKNKTHRLILIYFLFLSGISFLVIASFWWEGLDTELKIDITFSETKILSTSVYEKLLDDSTKKLNLNEITEIIENHPYVKVARVSRHYPSKLIVEIIERTPIAIVNKNPMIFLDEESFVLPEMGNLNDYNLPILSNFNTDSGLYPDGKQALSTKVIECTSIIKQLKNRYTNLYNNLSELKITSDNEIELILADHPTHIYLGSKNIYNRIYILKEFENKLKPNSISNFNYLDFRYENQIIANNRKS